MEFWSPYTLLEADITENFIRGSGKGGMKVNAKANCVQLIHNPSGLMIKCHEERELSRNRSLARRELEVQLDNLFNGPVSKFNLKEFVRREKNRSKKRNENKDKSDDD
ncbi:hypothetical protein ROZALSC1DRAFT_12984 [Rozella allomycis CSF55]|uniref:Prokaryotic-type class I peptide chain release factors domain-containing protein n=1 Tax=Rozella allomycis (strain CSF55) TaxID=988480 RepID=A0A4P9YL42_ROZAC|nr:hypothetical protein ROZALSC1DRAFT_12984 [Rozella allomycis CSF55]